MKFIDKFLHEHTGVYVACSGGSDSLALLHYTRMIGLDPTIAFFNHGDSVGDEEYEFLHDHAIQHGFDFVMDGVLETKPLCKKSPKEFHRENRYAWLDTLVDKPILVGHTLDDVAEGFLFYMIRNGEGHLIPYQRGNCYRPFLLNTKKECQDFLRKKGIRWFEDPTNLETKYTRNFIRHEMIPLVHQVNPGFNKVVKRKLVAKLTLEGVLDK